jgi:ATP-dependent helicase HrpB
MAIRLPDLPIDHAIPELLQKMQMHSCVILVAEPGAGKSTRVPIHVNAARDTLGLGPGKIIMLQPRRVAARALAEWMAHENGWALGKEIGYQVRFEKRTSAETRIEIITEGLLIQRLLNDPSLSDTSCIILDEFHERSIHLDLSLALLKETTAALRPDLKILIMSATLDAQPLLKYWPGSTLVLSEGRQYPVESTYSQTPISLGGGPPLIERALKAVINVADARRPGHTLVFLPGVNEIRRAVELAQGNPRLSAFRICALHGQMILDEQMDVLNPSEDSKIIFTTNIAETSLTVDNVTTVIDSGLLRMASFDRRTGVESLALARASRSSQRQRQGRAGRQRAGICIKLWAKSDELSTPEQTAPEIVRTDLADTLMVLAAWGVRDPLKFDWFEPPEVADLVERRKFLQMLELVDQDGKLTALGARVREWPVNARFARLIYESALVDRLAEGAASAAILSERDFVLQSASLDEFVNDDSDLLARMALIQDSRAGRSVHESGRRAAAQLLDLFVRLGRSVTRAETKPFEVAILRCFPDRICKRRPSTRKAKMIGGRGIELDARSLCTQAEYFVALQLRSKENQADLTCSIAHPLPLDLILSTYADSIRVVATEFQSETGRWIRRETKFLDDLELGFPKEVPLTEAESRERWKLTALRQPLESLLTHEAFRRWHERVQIFNRHGGSIELSETVLKNLAEYWIEGHSTLTAALQTSPLRMLDSLFPKDTLQLLDREIPDHLQVPSGSWIKVQYRPNDPPILSVRLQELFGWTQTPVLANGKLTLILELLGPNYRPIQITQDLKSFWSKTYFEIRKELRLKYPKHSWPEDPISAKAVAKGGVKQR